MKAYPDDSEDRAEIAKYIRLYNTERQHQTLGYKTPTKVCYAITFEEAKDRMLEYPSSRIPASIMERIAFD